VVAPAAFTAQEYGLTGVSVLWSAAQAAAALIAIFRLRKLSLALPAADPVEVPPAALNQSTGIEKP
jgi:hypothetical protein